MSKTFTAWLPETDDEDAAIAEDHPDFNPTFGTLLRHIVKARASLHNKKNDPCHRSGAYDADHPCSDPLDIDWDFAAALPCMETDTDGNTTYKPASFRSDYVSRRYRGILLSTHMHTWYVCASSFK